MRRRTALDLAPLKGGVVNLLDDLLRVVWGRDQKDGKEREGRGEDEGARPFQP